MRVVISDFISLDGDQHRDRAAVRAAHVAGHGRCLAGPGRGPVRRPHELRPEVRGLRNPDPGRPALEQLAAAAAGGHVGAVRQLRDEEGGDPQVLGSLTLARTLISSDLVDEYRLMVEPILLGGGKRLFPDDGQDRALELVDSRTSKTGVLVCTYRPVRSVS